MLQNSGTHLERLAYDAYPTPILHIGLPWPSPLLDNIGRALMLSFRRSGCWGLETWPGVDVRGIIHEVET